MRDYNKLVENASDRYKSLSRNNRYIFQTATGPRSIVELVTTLEAQSVIDYGCGNGNGTSELQMRVDRYDPFVPEFSAKLTHKADIVVCYNVLNVIDNDDLPVVLEEIYHLCEKFAIFNIRYPGWHARKECHEESLIARNWKIIEKCYSCITINKRCIPINKLDSFIIAKKLNNQGNGSQNEQN